MIKHLSKLVFCLLVLALSGIVHSGWAQTYKRGVRQGLVKVKFKTSMTESVSRMQINKRSNGLATGIASFDEKTRVVKASNMYRLFPYDARNEAKMRRHGLHLWYVVEFDESMEPKAVANHFAELSEISHAEVEQEKVIAPYTVEPYQPGPSTLEAMPFNDPMLKDQWHYNNTAQTGFSDADINVFKAWETTSGANNIIVSVHDEGVDVIHEDLRENVWVNADEIAGNDIDDDGNGYIDDVNGFNFSKNKGKLDAQFHGTHVAGTIAAMNNNGTGVSGVAGGNGSGNGVKVMSLQILGGGLIERSYVYAANNGAVVSQNSWGYTTPDYFDESVREAIDYFIDEAGNYEGSPMRGGIVIFASGNSNFDGAFYPGGYERVFSVSALGPEWQKAAYSNYGAWVEISAPGGDQINYAAKNGVLSTIPGNQYAYIQGTSMACPHVSGIAALVLANREKQLTSAELWQKLITSVVPIDQYNGDYIGKLGAGAIDASLAIRNDENIAPGTITDLVVTGVAQEFAVLRWSVPVDTDDHQPKSFTIHINTSPITATNLHLAKRIDVENLLDAGQSFDLEISELLGHTQYYFAVTSTDRWGHTSQLSNIASASTNDGPIISVEPDLIEMSIDARTSTTGTSSFILNNSGAGILRWSSSVRHRSTELAFNASSLHYPTQPTSKSAGIVGRQNITSVPTIKSNGPVAASFSPVEKTLSGWPTNLVGEIDLTRPNSAAARFHVSEPNGFNLTQVGMYLKHDPAKGPVIVEIYKGSVPVKSNLLYAQEYTSWTDEEITASINLNEQIYFESGSTFCVAFHVPSGNLFPFGIGYENETSSSANCFYSANVGSTWQSLEDALNDKEFAWSMSASSYNEFLGTYLSLNPESGDVNSNEETVVTVNADATTLINGSYSANVVLKTNDADHEEVRIPVNVIVSGHQPDIRYSDIADFGPAFVGESKIINIELNNQGYGNFSDPEFTITGNDFYADNGTPWKIAARETVSVPIRFNPSSPGSKNAMLRISNGTYTYTVALTGIGAETSKISITPSSQSVDDITIGDEVTAHVKVENTGSYPLKYFIPGHDVSSISENWPTPYHKYGYAVRTSDDATNPIPYTFQDISTTGIDISDKLNRDDAYATVDIGFSFPYYGELMKTIYVAQKGFTTFDNSVRPINTPVLNNGYSPAGYISPLGTFLTYIAEGKIFYKSEADRLIIQYHNVTDGNSGNITAQMVLYSNGDIRFFYDHIGFPESSLIYLTILIENTDRNDGILLHNYSNPISLYDGFAIGLDYPGPDIITQVTNGSGILAAGTSQDIEVRMNTTTLWEGQTKKYINFISNDPSNPQANALIELNIGAGGTANPVLSLNEVDFGNVFQGASLSKAVTIKNEGTANADINSISLANNKFTVTGTTPFSIKPGLYAVFTIGIPTAETGLRSDVMAIYYNNGSTQYVTLQGHVIDPPAIVVDLSPIAETLNHGDSVSHAFSIKNTGIADLEVATTGTQWLSFSSEQSNTGVSYAVEKQNTGGIYQWIDIRKTGVQMPFMEDFNSEDEYWRELELPFTFEYFGDRYSKLKIGDNGVISFEAEPSMMTFADSIPSIQFPGAHIMPYWSFSGFDVVTFPKEEVGIFYELFDDRVIITWSYITNFFGGMGDPVSAQAILYKDGTIKFQYKAEEGGSDLTSQFTFVGLQHNSSEGIMISDRLALDHGKGLAYVILPTKKNVVAPGATLTGEIKLTATRVYGGEYNGALKIYSNVPGNEILEKPVQLTVNGTGMLSVPVDFDFGDRIVASESGMPKVYTEDIEISNTGLAPLEITWIETASLGAPPLSLQVYTLVDGWFGPTWEWADIAQIYSPWYFPNPVFSLMPGERLKARLIFYPTEAGEFNDEVVFITSVGNVRMNVIGTGNEPPVISVETESIDISMKTMTEVATNTIVFNNANGKSDLTYSISVDFQRGAEAQSSENTSTVPSSLLKSIDANIASSMRPSSVYHREIRHSAKDVAEGHVGTGGSAPFPVATRFNAGPEGFMLSHVETWFRAENMTEGILEVEVRAGGASIADAITLTHETVPFTRSGNDEDGAWKQIALQNAVRIYPNEDFYVIVTYPLGIEFPTGIIQNQEAKSEVFLYYESGIWFDLQGENNFRNTAWLMYAGEIEAGVTSWLTISDPLTGSLEPELSNTLDLSINGAYSQRGDQTAFVIITSNDPVKSEVRVPVSLHMNEAPQFLNTPVMLSVAENDTLEIDIRIKDSEGDVISASALEPYAHLNVSFTNNTLTLRLTPDHSSEGNFEYALKATDEWGAETIISIPVEIMHSNQAPQFIGTNELFELSPTAELLEYGIETYFMDPDHDEIAFTASSADVDVLEIFFSVNKFLMKPKHAGETTIEFVVSDGNGGTTVKSIQAKVSNIMAAEGSAINGGVTIFPNPVEQTLRIYLNSEWNAGAIAAGITDIRGVMTLSEQNIEVEDRSLTLDVSSLSPGIYILEIKFQNKQAVLKFIKK